MRTIKLFFLFFALLATPSIAQTDKETEEVYKENRTLRKTIDQKDSEIEKLQKENAKLAQNIEKVNADLRAEKESSKAADFKKQIAELKAENAELKKQLEELEAAAKNAKEAGEKASSAEIVKLQEQHQKDQTKINELSKDLSELGNFRKMWLLQLAESVDEKWLSKSYSQIDIDALKKDYALYEEYSNSDVKVKDAYNKLTKLVQECEIYNEGKFCVENPYNGVFVFNALNKVKSLKGKASGSKGSEINTLYQQLDDYKATIEVFRDLIDAVDKVIAGMPNHKAAWPMAKATIDKMEKDDEYVTYINAIPWLSKQYAEYYKQLSTNCTAKNKARDLIMNIQL